MDKPAENNGHAKYAPSGSHRWLACHGSIALSEGVREARSSYAEEGTECHDAAAKVLRGESWNDSTVDLSEEQIEIVQEYTDYIFDTLDKLNDKGLNPKIWVETYNTSDIHREWAGTSDCGIKAGRTLGIFDLKAGYVPVRVDDPHYGINPQLGSYAVTFMDSHKLWQEIDNIRLTIVQPRVYDKPQSISISRKELIEFAYKVEKHIDAIEGGDKTLTAGEHCTFCPAKGRCPELRKKAVEKAKMVFDCPKEPKDYTNEEIAEILNEAEMIWAHVEGARQYARREMEKGRKIPGWKLVEKRAAYKWTDINEAIATVRALEIPRDELFTEKIKTPLQIKKVLKEHRRPEGVIDKYFVKESSGTTLAREDDKRDAVKPQIFPDET